MKQCSLGIDEAGYGPLLGPLVVGLAGFDAPRPTALAGPLTVGDSKRLLARRGGLAKMESVVLGMSEFCGQGAPTLGAWLDNVTDGASASLRESPWFEDLDVALPIFATTQDAGQATDLIGRGELFAGGAFRGFYLSVHSARMFNEQVGENKHSLLTQIVMELVVRARDPESRCRVLVDRLGGRRQYERLLTESFPFTPVAIEKEERRESRYEVGFEEYPAVFSFEVGGDDRHFEIALASMAAKYAREALMHLFNGFWAARAPAVQGTKGYYTDGQRFLRELGAAGVLADVDRSILQRSR